MPREVELAGLDYHVFETMVQEDEEIQGVLKDARLAPAE